MLPISRNAPPMLLFAVILLAWLIVALAAVALCVYARDADEEIAQAEPAGALQISSAA
jgi:hypothetical protein